MTTKYPDSLVEWLLENNTSQDEVGNSSDGIGWAGIFQFESVAFIVEEATDGTVTYQAYTEGSSVAWEEACARLDLDRAEPDVDDYVIEDRPQGGYAISPGAMVLNSYDDAIMAVAGRMNMERFWPDVWLVSDHGNFTKLNMTEELSRIKNEEAGKEN